MNLQIPTGVPSADTNTPIDLNNPFDVLVYIVAPVALIILYLYLRKRNRNVNDEEDSNASEE